MTENKSSLGMPFRSVPYAPYLMAGPWFFALLSAWVNDFEGAQAAALWVMFSLLALFGGLLSLLALWDNAALQDKHPRLRTAIVGSMAFGMMFLLAGMLLLLNR